MQLYKGLDCLHRLAVGGLRWWWWWKGANLHQQGKRESYVLIFIYIFFWASRNMRIEYTTMINQWSIHALCVCVMFRLACAGSRQTSGRFSSVLSIVCPISSSFWNFFFFCRIQQQLLQNQQPESLKWMTKTLQNGFPSSPFCYTLLDISHKTTTSPFLLKTSEKGAK